MIADIKIEHEKLRRSMFRHSTVNQLRMNAETARLLAGELLYLAAEAEDHDSRHVTIVSNMEIDNQERVDEIIVTPNHEEAKALGCGACPSKGGCH